MSVHTIKMNTYSTGYITYSQVQALLKLDSISERPDLQYNEWRVYSLNPTRTLVINSDGSGILYPTFVCLFPDVDGFIEDVRLNIERLQTILRISKQDLDNSVGSLHSIDEAVAKRGSDFFLQPETFSSVVAYVGEVVRALVGGKWCKSYVAISDHDFDIGWVPAIATNRTHIPLAVLLRNILIEWGYWSSIQQQISIRWG